MNTKHTNPFTDLFAGLEHDEEYLAIDFAELFDREIQRAMKAQGVNRKELAERIEVSPARITKLLSGEENLTVRSMVKVALALGLKVEPKVSKIGVTESAVPEVKTKEFKSTLPTIEGRIEVREGGARNAMHPSSVPVAQLADSATRSNIIYFANAA